MALEDKTEAATVQRRQEARKQGQVARSMDVTTSLSLLGALIALKACAPAALGQLSSAMAHYLGNLSSFSGTPQEANVLLSDAVRTGLRVLAPVLGAAAGAGLLVSAAQVGVYVSPKPISPDFSRINPLKGVSRMFSRRALVELMKSLLKVTIVGWVVWSFLSHEKDTILRLGMVDHRQAGQMAADVIWRLCLRACTTLLALAALDYLYQRMEFEKSIRMTRQEVKEEMRRSEGDPVIKSQFRRKHRQLAMHRMVQAVKTADVVVTNPTHLAIALQYEPNSMAAPVVVAKGQRLIAERIKEVARENGIPLVENKPVARALFAATEIGDPVPVDLYQAVAQILAFVYRLRHPAGLGATR